MSFYSIENGVVIGENAPAGCIMAYLKTADVDGWVICDGVSRSNVDGKYRRLNGIGTFSGAITGGAGATYTPPNLKSKFLYGTATTTSVGGVGGAINQSITLTTAHLPAHNHGITDPGHGHGITDPGHRHGWNYGTETDDDGSGSSNREFTLTGSGNSPAATPINIATTGISINSATTGISTTNTGSGTAFSVNTVPPYYTVNYIMKY
jgi:microcystin-dependent protein